MVIATRGLASSRWGLSCFNGSSMVGRPPSLSDSRGDQLQQRLQNWQTARTWARLIREAEALWHVDVRALHRLAAQELAQLVQEVPPPLRSRVNRWLERFKVHTRLR